MRIVENKKAKSTILLRLLVLALLLGSGLVVYMIASGNTLNTPTDTSRTNTNTPTQITDSHDGDNTNSTTGTPITQEEKPPVQGDQPAPNNGSTLTGTINYAAVNNEKLSIRTTIYQRLASGICTLTLTNKKTKATVQKTADIIPNPSSATCKGFDIPTSSLGSGTWDISIKIEGGNATGTITGGVTI